MAEIECPSCGDMFTPRRIDSKHCSRACRDRARDAVRRQSPEYQAQRRQYLAEYHIRNRDARVASAREWRESNRDRHRELSVTWYWSNRERALATSAAWSASNNERRVLANQRRRAKKAESPICSIQVEHVIQKMAYWGGKCWMCSRPADTLDHVKPLAAGGYHMLANLRPACRSCNSSKGAKWFGPENLSKFIRL